MLDVSNGGTFDWKPKVVIIGRPTGFLSKIVFPELLIFSLNQRILNGNSDNIYQAHVQIE